MTERDAVEAARRFLADRGHAPWDEASLTIRHQTIDGRKAWVIHALDALPADDPEWMRPDRQPVLYYVDAETGRLFGYEVRSVRTIFG